MEPTAIEMLETTRTAWEQYMKAPVNIIASENPTCCPRCDRRTEWSGVTKTDEDGGQYNVETCAPCDLTLHVYEPTAADDHEEDEG